jgi:predicted transcriptional regulator
MDNAPLPDGDVQPARVETEAERQRRLAWEAEMIAEADTEIAAGLVIEEADVDAWIDSLGTDHELPLPQPRRR